MKIEKGLYTSAVILDEGEDITDLLEKVSIFDKTYFPKEKTWYIKNSKLEYVKRMLKKDQQYSLFE